MSALTTSSGNSRYPEALRLHPERFLNRELSWIAFNERVLHEANSLRHPLLERLRFLSISHTNLVEFYNVRVAGLIAQERAQVKTLSQDGLNPTEQLAAIRARTAILIHKQQQTWLALRYDLQQAGITIILPEHLNEEDKHALDSHFQEAILPLLTPIAIDPAHPFPFLPNGGVAFAVALCHPKKERDILALLPIPKDIPRFVPLAGHTDKFILLEDVIALFLDRLFPTYKLRGKGLFQVLRDSEIEIDDEAEDLVQHMESALKRRRRGNPIQLMMDSTMPEALRIIISAAMQLDDDDIFAVDGLVNMSDVAQLVTVDKPDLRFTSYEPRFPERIRDFNGDCFAAIRHKDILVHHPYESFDVVVQFLRQAARDPDVLVIKQTLYRTSTDSPIVQALIQKPALMKKPTCNGRATWNVPACMSCLALCIIRRTLRFPLLFGAKTKDLKAMFTLVQVITIP
jgi:polyphosphate kinase